MRIALILFLYSTIVSAFLPSQEKLNADRVKEATLSIEVWKRPIDPNTGRRVFGKRDSLVSRGVGVHLGKGYILTALHIMLPIIRKENHHFLKVIDSNGNGVNGLALSRCEVPEGPKAVDLCLLKGEVRVNAEIELPKDLNFTPTKEQRFGLINQNENHAKLGEVLIGSYVKTITPKGLGEGYNGNKGIDLFRTNIKTAKANSGSVVFDRDSKRILGVTTNAIRVSRKTASTSENWLEAEVIPSQIIRKFLNTPGWKTKKLSDKQTSYSKR